MINKNEELRFNIVDPEFVITTATEDPSVIVTDGQTIDGIIVFRFHFSCFRLPFFIDCFAGGPQQNTTVSTTGDEQGPVVRELDGIDFFFTMMTIEFPAVQWLRGGQSLSRNLVRWEFVEIVTADGA